MARVGSRPKTAIGGAVVLAAIVAGVLVLALHDGTPKLSEGSYAQAGDGRRHTADPALDDAVTQLDLKYQEGRDATFTLSVRNDGDHAVTLVGASVLGANAMLAKRG